MATTTKARNGTKAAAKSKTTKSARVAKAAPKGKKKAKSGPRKPSLDTLGYAIVYVSDMDRGIAFYRDVLGIPLRFGDAEWTEFEMKGFTLALHHAEQIPANLDRAAITELCFAAEDVRGTRKQLLDCGVDLSELHSVCDVGNAVGACASFRDPDGNHLSIFGFVPKKEWTGHGEACC